MTRFRGSLLVVPALLVVALTACTGGGSNDGRFKFRNATKPGTTIAVADRKPIPTVTGSLLDGSAWRVASSAGKVVVLNFWGSWCGPCQTETPRFDKIYRAEKAKGVEFVGIAIKDDKDATAKFVADYSISFPIVFDEPAKTAQQLGNLPTQGIPMTIVVDRQQRVAGVYITPLQEADLDPVLAELVAET